MWKIVKCKCDDDFCNSYIVDGLMMSDGRMEKKDAQLISAAPELLEACKEVIRLNNNREHMFNGHTLLIKAIEKAEGE